MSSLSGSNVLLSTGNNANGELGQGYIGGDAYLFTKVAGSRYWDEVVCGNQFVYARSGITWYSVGSNTVGQLGQNDLVNRGTFTEVPGLWSKIACGNSHAMALSAGGKLYGVGFNLSGQLGLGTTTSTLSFTPLTGTWDDVICGGTFTYALSNGTWFGVGANSSGQLGLGDTTNRNRFAPIPGNWSKIKCNTSSAYALSGNRLYSTGGNNLGQLGLNDTTNRTVFTRVPGLWEDVATGSNSRFAFALSGGKWHGAGQNTAGQLGLGDVVARTTFTINPTAAYDDILTGDGFSYGLSGSRIYVTGLNNDGQLALGNTVSRRYFTPVLGEWSDVAIGGSFAYVLSETNCNSIGFTKVLDVYNKDLVITIDYEAYGSSMGGGFLLGFLPYYRVAPDGYVLPSDGLGYSSPVSGYGVKDAQVGVGFDFDGLFSTTTASNSGLSAATPNSICIRGEADRYDLITVTNNLTAHTKPFTLSDTVASAAVIKNARVRVSEFGKQILVDLKNKPEQNYTNYVNIYLPNFMTKYVRFYIAYSTYRTDQTFKIQNINVNGYDVSLTYLVSGATYMGLSAAGSAVYPVSAIPHNEGDYIGIYNYFGYPPTLSTLFSAYSSLGPLILVNNDSGMPYVAGDDYVAINYTD